MPNRPLLPLSGDFARDVPGGGVAWSGAPAPAASVAWLNEPLAAALGLDADRLRGPDGAAALSGSVAPAGASPVAQVYAGHQFGGFSPRLGDGRALLLGELAAPGSARLDLHLKGSGRTPFSRGGDGKAVLGPVLRECIVGEAMHALGVPTTRALAATLTGETVWRDGPAPGAVLARVAASHLRVGSFEYAASLPRLAGARGDADLLARLADHAIARHDPDLAGRDDRYLAFFASVAGRQARLVAQWMAVGFVHGVMNTDNVAVSGETLDYGPCAFLDAYDPAAVFSSIDTGGRYAFGNQPHILVWNLARFAEALLPLVAGADAPDDDVASAVRDLTDALDAVPAAFDAAYLAAMRARLGLSDDDVAGDALIVADWLALLARTRADYTASHRALASAARDDASSLDALIAGDADATAARDAWLACWRDRLAAQPGGAAAAAEAMDRTNPLVIPRNHVVEAALDAAVGPGGVVGDLAQALDLIERVRRPFDAAPGADALAAPPPPGTPRTVTFCGT